MFKLKISYLENLSNTLDLNVDSNSQLIAYLYKVKEKTIEKVLDETKKLFNVYVFDVNSESLLPSGDDVQEVHTYSLQTIQQSSSSCVDVDIHLHNKRYIAQRYAIVGFFLGGGFSQIAADKNALIDDVYPILEYDKLKFLNVDQNRDNLEEPYRVRAGHAEYDPTREGRTFELLQLNLHRKTPYCLNRGFSVSYNVPYVPIEDQITIATSYSEKQVKEWCKKVANKKLDMFFLGLGGMNMNVVENLIQLCQYFGIKNLFEKIIIVEPEVLDYHNLFRFNTPAYLRDGLFHINLENFITNVADYMVKQNISERKISRLSKFALLDKSALGQISQKTINLAQEYISNKPDFNKILQKAGVEIADTNGIYIFGSPAVETRFLFSEISRENKNKISFLCSTHQGNEVQLKKNPTPEDSALIVETYGTIRLTPFFINMLRVTIETLKYIAENDISSPDGLIYEEEFKGLNGSKYKYNENFFMPKEGVLL